MSIGIEAKAYQTAETVLSSVCNGNDINQCRVIVSEHTRCNKRPAGYQTRSTGASDSRIFKLTYIYTLHSSPDVGQADDIGWTSSIPEEKR